MSEAVDPEPECPADPCAEFAFAATVVAAIVCFGTLGFAMLSNGGSIPAAYLTHLVGTWLAPTVIVVVGWIVYFAGRGARCQGRSPVASKALGFLVLHTVVLGLFAAFVVLLAAALRTSFG